MWRFKHILKPRQNAQQLLKGWQRRLRQECRNIEHQIKDVEGEEKSLHRAIREAVKRNDIVSAREGMIEEMVNDAVDTALDTEDIEKETEEEVNKVLAEIAGETGSQHPESVRKVKIELPAHGACPASEAHVTPLPLGVGRS